MNALTWFEPFIVISPGRSGSSTVARILHERCGVFMGKQFRRPDQTNPQGFYEDLEFKKLNDELLAGVISRKDFCRATEWLIIERRARYTPWGLKDPRLCELYHLYSDYFDTPAFIRCRRHRSKVVDSLMRSYDFSRPHAERAFDNRTDRIDNFTHEHRVLEIDFDEQQSDEYLADILSSFIQEVRIRGEKKPSSNPNTVQQEA